MSQKVLVAGTGKSGIAAAKLLLAMGGEVVLYDGNDKLDQEKKQIEQEVKLFMEDAEKADSDKYSITWKSIVSSRVDSKKLKADHPDIYKEYAKESSSRRFTVKEIA